MVPCLSWTLLRSSKQHGTQDKIRDTKRTGFGGDPVWWGKTYTSNDNKSYSERRWGTPEKKVRGSMGEGQ